MHERRRPARGCTRNGRTIAGAGCRVRRLAVGCELVNAQRRAPRALTHLEAPVEGGGRHAPTVVSSRSVGFKRHRAPFTWNAHGLNATAMGVGQRYASAQLAGRMPPMFRSVLARVRPGAGPAWRSDPSPVLQLRRNRRTIRRAQARQPKRVDTMQVVRALTAPSYERRRRPVAAMWAGHAEALLTLTP